MSLQGARVIGLLLAWLSIGFFLDAATAGYQHELDVEVHEQLRDQARDRGEAYPVDPPPPPTRTGVAITAGVGGLIAAAGTFLLLAAPGEGRTPGVALGHAPVAGPPKRCWQCRGSWPRDASACPHCGAERLR